MQFGCAIFLTTVVVIACAILAALSLLFRHMHTPRASKRETPGRQLEAVEEREAKRHSAIAKRPRDAAAPRTV
jgi:hypothetical protein